MWTTRPPTLRQLTRAIRLKCVIQGEGFVEWHLPHCPGRGERELRECSSHLQRKNACLLYGNARQNARKDERRPPEAPHEVASS